MRFMGGFADKSFNRPQNGSQHAVSRLSMSTDMLLGGKQTKMRREEKRLRAEREEEDAYRLRTQRDEDAHRLRVGREDDAYQLPPIRRQEDLGSLMQAHEEHAMVMPHTMEPTPKSRGKPRLQIWPDVERQSKSANGALAEGVMNLNVYHANSNNGHPPQIPTRNQSTHATDQYHDRVTQPRYVLQQTSAPTVLDTGLRKGAPMSHETSSDPALAGQRPLKSAMKKQQQQQQEQQRQQSASPALRDDRGLHPEPDDLLKIRTNSNEKRSRRLDLSQLFSQPRGSNGRNLLPPNQTTRSPSAASDDMDSAHSDHGRWLPVRFARQQDKDRKPSPSPLSSDNPERAKAFDSDIYDRAKTNVRRPPKGIQNWFDGFEISSDEEMEVPQELPAGDVERKREVCAEALPSTFSTFGSWMKPEMEQPLVHRMSSGGEEEGLGVLGDERERVERQRVERERVEKKRIERKRVEGERVERERIERERFEGERMDRERVERERAERERSERERMWRERKERERIERERTERERYERIRIAKLNQRRGSIGSEDTDKVSALEPPHKKAPSRLALSRLASESVLSLSDSEGEEEQETRPPVRDSVDNASITLGNAASVSVERLTVSATRSINHVRSPPRLDLARVTSASTVQTSGSIPIRLTNSFGQIQCPPIGSPPTDLLNPTQPEHTARTLHRLEGTRESFSQPSASRPTTKTSARDCETVVSGDTSSSMPTETSHIMAVTEEEMALLEMMRRKRAMMAKNSFTEGYQHALLREQEHLLKRREFAHQTALQILRAKEGRKQTRSSHANSRNTSTSAPDLPQDLLEEANRRKYSALRKEDVDKALKIERFLSGAGAGGEEAEELSLEDAFPEPPTGDSASAPPQREEEAASKHRPRSKPLQPQRFELLLPDTYSPATERSRRASGRSEHEVSPEGTMVADMEDSPVPGEEDIEDHHDRVRRFLAENHFSGIEASSLQGMKHKARRRKGSVPSTLGSGHFTLEEEEEEEEVPVPKVPERSRYRSSQHDHSNNEDVRKGEEEDPRPSAFPQPLTAPDHHLPPNLSPAPLHPSPTATATIHEPLTPSSPHQARTEHGTTAIPKKKNQNRTPKRALPPRIDTVLGATPHAKIEKRRDGGGRGSGFTSASEDVLAAWAELGGSTGEGRRRRGGW